uniref:Putative ovule protein n=1 Tax=Solanum chacoense TaxID=4108 RepID=A0A0V0H9U3_SOLCH
MRKSNRDVHHLPVHHSPSRTDVLLPKSSILGSFATICNNFQYSSGTSEKAQTACFSPLRAL